ncbi:monovalent cation/H(+) antiporter subunit G [Aquihabitans sp. G128]|uniref:monovalent cation/H(+) antiporter subunit G n=1 Tax=Aquihabitans sp. G128 TaxID=2849779 RepID=UPI001C21CF5C|nr:monovalent cation/H(+) antiporter subunit G [Aquihabitans sp. G128]QXC59655.1 monovalent cation/H(+) antiporter subunit G [Aquihabitans sp. G128]
MMDAVGAFLILLGAAFGALAGLGQLKFSDLFVRMHVATKPSTLGLVLVATGAMARIDGRGVIPVLLLTIAMQLLTAPVAAHLVGRAAHRQGEWERDEAVLDQLADIDEL